MIKARQSGLFFLEDHGRLWQEVRNSNGTNSSREINPVPHSDLVACIVREQLNSVQNQHHCSRALQPLNIPMLIGTGGYCSFKLWEYRFNMIQEWPHIIKLSFMAGSRLVYESIWILYESRFHNDNPELVLKCLWFHHISISCCPFFSHEVFRNLWESSLLCAVHEHVY
jgi:hypothetical protein